MTSNPAQDYVPQFTLGDRLRRLRRDQGLNQADFAALLGQTEKAYGAWETGTNTPRGSTLMELGYRVHELYGDKARDWLMGWGNADRPPPGRPVPPSAAERDRRIADLAAKQRERNGHAGAVTDRYLIEAA